MKLKHLFAAVLLLSLLNAFAIGEIQGSLSFNGLGKVKIGATFAQVQKSWDGQIPAVSERLKASPTCFHVSPKRHPEVTFMFMNDRLARIDLTAAPGKTDEGIVIGDAADKVLKVYNGMVRESAEPDTSQEYLTVWSGNRQSAMRFYTEKSIVRGISAGNAYAVSLEEGCY